MVESAHLIFEVINFFPPRLSPPSLVDVHETNICSGSSVEEERNGGQSIYWTFNDFKNACNRVHRDAM